MIMNLEETYSSLLLFEVMLVAPVFSEPLVSD